MGSRFRIKVKEDRSGEVAPRSDGTSQVVLNQAGCHGTLLDRNDNEIVPHTTCVVSCAHLENCINEQSVEIVEDRPESEL